jgi:hypothetical protein
MDPEQMPGSLNVVVRIHMKEFSMRQEFSRLSTS